MTERLDPIVVRSEKRFGESRMVYVTASVPRARTIAQRILRGYNYDEYERDAETETSLFYVTGKVKQ